MYACTNVFKSIKFEVAVDQINECHKSINYFFNCIKKCTVAGIEAINCRNKLREI